VENKSKFLEVGLEAVKKAEEIIKKYYLGEVETSLKDNGSPVTVADKEAEKVIRETISSVFPDHMFLGEEMGRSGVGSEYMWVIDSIDGTKNFVRGLPLFTTLLALIKDGEIILGISNAPIMNECLYAEKGCGAYFNGEKINVSGVKDLKNAYMSYGGLTYFVDKKVWESLLKLNRDTHFHRALGDFWSFHLLAQGKLDLMVEADIRIWDIAPLVCIIQEAGGKITDLQGKKIELDSDTVLATNGFLHNQVVKYFKK
jgi:histidinol-phosphatase